MCFGFEPHVSVVFETLTSSLTRWFVTAYDFSYSRKAGCKRKHPICQVYQQVAFDLTRIICADADRGTSLTGNCQQLVGYETTLAKRPQHFIQSRSFRLRRHMCVDSIAKTVGLFG
jgi:hypothetical protein